MQDLNRDLQKSSEILTRLCLHSADKFRNDLSTQYAKCSRIICPYCNENRTIKVVQKQEIWCQLHEKQIVSMLKITKMAEKNLI